MVRLAVSEFRRKSVPLNDQTRTREGIDTLKLLKRQTTSEVSSDVQRRTARRDEGNGKSV